ncbi:MAG: peptide ABC transporter substrate-binding protein [Spirochaetales bacterium]
MKQIKFPLIGIPVIIFLSFFILSFNASIQKELVIIDSVHNYDLNPHTASYSSESQVLNALYEGLFTYNPMTLEPIPAIAESFSISLDKTQWIFTLRQDAMFSNGERITADDVKNSWIALLDPNLHAPFASLFDCIKGVADYRTGKGELSDVGITAKNKTTLIVQLNTPTDYFSKILTHHAFAVVPSEKGVYSGAYTLKERTASGLVFEKSNTYYDAKNVAIPSIRIINDDDVRENTYLFNMGDVQWVTGGVNINNIYDDSSLYISAQFATEFIFFKAGNKPWDDPVLRNAVIAAMPWESLRNNLVSAETLVLPIGDYPKVIGTVEQDIEYAKELLKEAGYDLADGNDLPELTFAIPDGEYTRNMAMLISEALAEVGITVRIETTPTSRYLGTFDGWDADLFIYTWIGDFADPLSFLDLFRSDSSLRETEWVDSHYDSLLEQAAYAENPTERYKKLAEAEQYLLDEGIVLPISHPVSFNVVDTGVLGGWYPNALDIHPYKYLYFIETTTGDNFI